MLLLLLLIIILVLLIVCIYTMTPSNSNCKQSNLGHQSERFSSTSPTRQSDPTSKGTIFPSTTSYPNDTLQNLEAQSIKNNINSRIFDQVTFNDIVVMPNDPITGQTGIDQCLTNKEEGGHCVQYGPTGVAYYYPPRKTNLNYGQIIDLSSQQQHYDTIPTPKYNLFFPALR